MSALPKFKSVNVIPAKARKPDLKSTTDELGEVKAQIADLAEKEDQLKQVLLDSGRDEVEGKLFRCTISRFQAVNVNYKAVLEELPPSPVLSKLLKQNTSVADRVSVRVVSR